MENRSTLDPQLWRLFNQRRTVRVEPEEEMKLVLRGKYGKKMRAKVRDLSEEGLGLWIRRQGAEAAPEGARLDMTLQLPGMRKEIDVRAVAKHLKIWQGAPVQRTQSWVRDATFRRIFVWPCNASLSTNSANCVPKDWLRLESSCALTP